MFFKSYSNVFIKTSKVWKWSKSLSSTSKSHFWITYDFFPECRFTLIFNILGMTIIQCWLSQCFRIKDCIVLGPVTDMVYPTGSRLAHFYVLPKTHKDRLEMHPILSATRTYNFALGTCLDTKLVPLSLSRCTVTTFLNLQIKSSTWKSQTVTTWFRTTCLPCLSTYP